MDDIKEFENYTASSRFFDNRLPVQARIRTKPVENLTGVGISINDEYRVTEAYSVQLIDQ